MKIILHMGQGKTGTTSLQKALHAVAPQLREKGVLYPRFGRFYTAHHLLVALSGVPASLPAWQLEDLGGAENAARIAKRVWKRTCTDIRSTKPELVIFSSEYLVQQTGAANKAVLARRLSDLSDEIIPVVYIRHPVERYRARLQQWLRHRDRPFPPRDEKLKQAILDTEAAFGRRPELLAFDRKTLHGAAGSAR